MITILIKIYLITWLFTNYEPLQNIINNIFDKLIYKNKLISKILNNIHIILGCHKCLSFITTLIITHNIYFAITLAIITQIHKKLI